ncbi:MAG: lysylphosphatidylglycerol synthase transmembrane domain-containing protein [Dehalococcoidia bacterium]
MTIPPPQSRVASLPGSALRHRLLNLPNLLALIIALSLVYFLVARFDFDLSDTWDRVGENSFIWYALAFVVYYLIFPLRGLRWRFLLEGAGCDLGADNNRISTVRLTELSFLGWFVNTITIFRMGFVYRCHLLSRQLKSSFALVAGSLFAERILDTVITSALLLVAGLWLLSSGAAPFVAPALLGALVVSLVLAGPAIAMALAGINPGRILPPRLRHGYGNFRQGTVMSFRRWPWLVALSLAIWACESARLFLVVQALGLSVELPLIVFVALAASLIASFPITPGGLGLVEAGMTGLLTTSLPWEEAVQVALLDRSINYLSVVALGIALILVRNLPGLASRTRTPTIGATQEHSLE